MHNARLNAVANRCKRAFALLNAACWCCSCCHRRIFSLHFRRLQEADWADIEFWVGVGLCISMISYRGRVSFEIRLRLLVADPCTIRPTMRPPHVRSLHGCLTAKRFKFTGAGFKQLPNTYKKGVTGRNRFGFLSSSRSPFPDEVGIDHSFVGKASLDPTRPFSSITFKVRVRSDRHPHAVVQASASVLDDSQGAFFMSALN